MAGKVVRTAFSQWCLTQNPKYAQLPLEDNEENYVRSCVKNAVFSKVAPTPLEEEPRLVCCSKDAMENILDLDSSVADEEAFIKFVAGQNLPASAVPVAHRYGGHQFGMWVEQLGDGRAHLIGEYLNRNNEKWEVQLKGSGRTPYSRFGDGRSVLRSSIREMLASEACFYLGIPTTRAAALVVSDDVVARDMFYNMNVKNEKTAVLLRLSPSWFRIGSLQILARNNEIAILKQLCDYVIKEHYPEISLTDENRYVFFFNEIAHRSMDLVAKWQGFGFTHGVLNTDNISLLGLTIDYGPYGFVDAYDTGFIPNSSDCEGRYSLVGQPGIMLWNMGQLAHALYPLLNAMQKSYISQIMKNLDIHCGNKILETFLLKLGFEEIRQTDGELVQKLMEMMHQTGADFTMTFRQLTEINVDDLLDENCIKQLWALERLSTHASWADWVKAYKERILVEVSEEDRKKRMLAVNPRYVPRNWILQQAIAAAEKDDYEPVRLLLEIFKKPYETQEEAERKDFASQPPTWSYNLKVSCSS